MKFHLTLTEHDIRKILSDHIATEYGVRLDPTLLHIEVKSKQNYRSEWEHANIRLDVEVVRTTDGRLI